MCDSGIDETKVRVYKVFRPDCGKQHWVTEDWKSILDAEFDGSQDGDRIVIEIGTMTRDAIANLKDFEGW
jgi:hypothetical protein